MSLRGPVDAVGVLTRIPVPGWASADLAAAAPWFPLVGALTGLVVGVAGLAGADVWPPYVAALVAVAVELLLTGALHLDGLADCADATGGHTRERRLAILKDHAIGVYGAAAVALSLLLRVLVLGALLMLPGWWAVGCLVAVWTLSRAAMLPVALLLPSARADGTGRSVIEGITPLRCLLGLVGALVVVVVALGLVPVAGVGGVLGALAGAGIGALVPALWARSRLGGATGDVLGATAELALAGALLGLLAVLP